MRRCCRGAPCSRTSRCRSRSAAARRCPAPASPRELLSLVGLERLGAGLSARAVGRHAPARGDRPRAGLGPAAPADGRAVRRARRDHARPAERGAAAALGDRPARRSCSSRTRSTRRRSSARACCCWRRSRAGCASMVPVDPADAAAAGACARRRSSSRSPATCAACWRPADGQPGRTGRHGRRLRRGCRGRRPASSPTSATSPGAAACCRSAPCIAVPAAVVAGGRAVRHQAVHRAVAGGGGARCSSSASTC